MTENEAIKILQEAVDSRKYPMLTPVYELAIKSINKQISQEPIYHDNCGNKTVSARCPRCHEVFDESGLQKYCGFCGQKVKVVGIWKD